MKKFTFLLLLMFVYSISQAWPWGHRYTTEQANQNITVDINTDFTVSVEWGEGGWDADGSKFGYGTSTDGTGWTWVDLPWFQDGDGNNKRCKTTINISIPGKYYYAYRMDKSGTSYSFGSSDWAENSATLSAISTIIVGEVSKIAGSWSTNGTWEDDSPPTSSDNVAIMHDVNISSSGEAKSIYVYSSKTLTIEDNGSVTITDDLTNNGTFTIQSNSDGTGSLITTNGPISGSVTFQRYIVGHSDDNDHGWHFLASPVATFNIDGSNFDPGDGATPNDLYGWAESTGLWMNYKAGDPTQIVPGTGYFTAWQTTDTKEFSGTLNNSDIGKSDLSFTEGSDQTGWHLLGNPFPSALTWATNWSLSNVNTTAKIWNESSASYSDIASGGTIPATQGFMVNVTGATNSLTIPTADRIHSATAWYKDVDVNTIKLTAVDPQGSTAQESIIKFNENATTGFDNEFDSYFLPGYAPQFYSLINNEIAVSTNTFPEFNEQLSIPFTFIKNSSSNFSIEVEGINNLVPQTQVSLVDLKTNTTQNLLENPVYTFESSEGDDIERFLIQFGVLGLEEESIENKLNFYVYNNTLNIVNDDLQKGIIQIFDMLGQKVLEKTYSAQDNSFNIDLPSENYIVRIISGDKIANGKIHID